MTDMSVTDDVERIAGLLTDRRFETARRCCCQADAADPAIALLHSDALSSLGDVRQAMTVLESIDGALIDADAALSFEVGLRRAELQHQLRGMAHFRQSPERRAGWDYEEYQLHYCDLARATLAGLGEQTSAAQRARADALARRLGSNPIVAKRLDTAAVDSRPPATGPHRLRLRLLDGDRAVSCPVEIGIWIDDDFQPQPPFGQMHYHPSVPDCRCWQAASDADGRVSFAALPAGRLWLAVHLDEEMAPERLRFLLHDIHFPAQADDELVLDVAARRPCAAATAAGTWRFHNPTGYVFPRQAVHLDCPDGFGDDEECYWQDAPDVVVPHQLIDGQVLVMAEAAAESERWLCHRPGSGTTIDLLALAEEHGDLVVDTGCAAFRIPGPAAAADAPPIAALRRPGKAWRGCGRFVLPDGMRLSERRVEVVEHGPLALRVSISYTTDTGLSYCLVMTAHRDQPYLLVHEEASACEGASFHFDCDDFLGGRGFLAWNVENDSIHWSDLAAEDRQLARLQESVAWWISPCGFAYGMSDDGLDDGDFAAVFTRLRGDWDDRDFAAIAQGPGDDRREWDWPFPEMIGSTISMITAETEAGGRCGYTFNWFNGSRDWGLMIGAFAENDGPARQLWQVQQNTSSPRLEDFVTWQLDLPETAVRPQVLCTADDLPALRRKAADPAYESYWQALVGEGKHGERCSAELCALIEPDAYTMWKSKTYLARHLPERARISLLGRQWGDMYSPVGGRSITHHAERFDLLAACRAFSPDEEAVARASLLILGQLYLSCDHMNWRYGGRNANFEADRVDIVGTIGLCFRGHPLADAMIEHAVERMAVALDAYCTPGSGKWYENPACYYVHAMTCRLHLAALLHRHGLWSVEETPRINDCLRWALLLATPAYPNDHDLMRDGCTYEQWLATDKGRFIPPVGDHAKLGREIPECHVAMAPCFDQSDPQLANDLRWLYQNGARSLMEHSQYHLLFTGDDPALLEPAPPAALHSRRLEGFGTVMRHRFGESDEGYVLFKQGPGGYRYHRSEGSIIYFEHGVPLLFDGGEAGETWRHTTLARGATHMPLAAGHVERWSAGSRIDFAQGVHPLFIEPGMPIYTSDDCHHRLVAEAERRFNEPKPVDRRCCLYVKGDYLVTHDALDLPDDDEPIHWHVQVVGDDCREEGPGDWRFSGRYGIDVQVLLPDQRVDDWDHEHMAHLYYNKEPDECFGMRHLRLSASRPTGRLGIVRALRADDEALQASLLNGDEREPLLRVRGAGIDDLHSFALADRRAEAAGAVFDARYASLLRRADRVCLQLHDGRSLTWGGIELCCPDGGSAELEIDCVNWRYAAQGACLRIDALGIEGTQDAAGSVPEALRAAITMALEGLEG